MPNKNIVVIRADGNSKIGLGHIFRSLAIAEILRNNFKCVFATRFLDPTIECQIQNVCHSYVKLPVSEHYEFFLNYLNGDEIVVLDNYFYHEEYQKRIKERGCKLVCIDDLHDQHFFADIIINHAPGLDSSIYSTESYTKLCLGPKYSLIRSVFRNCIYNPEYNLSEKKIVFLCFGGSDYNNLSGRIIRLLDKHGNVNKINLVIGIKNKHSIELKKLIKELTIPVDLYIGLNAHQLVEVMKKSTMAIVPSSTILYEVLSVGLPTLSGYYINNQINIYKGFLEEGLILGCGNFEDEELIINSINIMQECKNTLLERQKEVFNGQSASKILKLITELL